MTDTINNTHSHWRTLFRIQKILDLDDKVFSEMLQMTASEFSIYRANQIEPKVYHLLQLMECLDLSLDHFVEGKIDYPLLMKNFSTSSATLPEQYTVNPLSKLSTVQYILNYIENEFGFGTRVEILRHFQVSESALTDPNGAISLKLAVDLSEWILKRYKDESYFYKMGQNSTEIYKNTEMGNKLAQCKNLQEVFEWTTEELIEKYVEKNFKWKLAKLNHDECLITGAPSYDIIESLNDHYVRSYTGTLIRQGFIASIPRYLDCPDAKVFKIRCISQGDPNSSFLIRFPPKKKKHQSPHTRLKLLS
jgi:hypothetical protein